MEWDNLGRRLRELDPQRYAELKVSLHRLVEGLEVLDPLCPAVSDIKSAVAKTSFPRSTSRHAASRKR